MPDVRIEIEIAIVDPPGAAALNDGALPEAFVAQQACFDGAAEALEIQAAIEDHDAHDLHQVRRPVHAQPRGVSTWEMRSRLLMLVRLLISIAANIILKPGFPAAASKMHTTQGDGHE